MTWSTLLSHAYTVSRCSRAGLGACLSELCGHYLATPG